MVQPWTSAPFLYPCLLRRLVNGGGQPWQIRGASTVLAPESSDTDPAPPLFTTAINHLNPTPTDYSRSLFADRCSLVVHAGAGGHGCISFLRDKYISAGPANGGDGGSGGNIYIQAVRGDTSLHKLARRGVLRAGRGKNGQGKGKGGERGEDLLLQVPVGTVVRENERSDPAVLEEVNADDTQDGGIEGDQRGRWRRDKWILHPASLPSEYVTAEFPALPRPRRSNLTLAQPPAPINLDLSSPMEKPILLAAGALGGLGNPHFVTKSITRPKFATKGEKGMSLTLDLELKILADVGLVGLPNAGKSTLLRALSRSRARIGNWAFTTLQPNIGTVVLDDYSGRPRVPLSPMTDGEPRTRFTIADIPGLVEDAHLDRGLGLGFLRHIERARILAFVVDLSRGDAVQAVKNLWSELREYDGLRDSQHPPSSDTSELEERMIEWSPFSDAAEQARAQPVSFVSSKRWFVVATKADLPDTQKNFEALQTYLQAASRDDAERPSGSGSRIWRGQIEAIPVSAIQGEGVERIVDHVAGLLK